MNKVTLDETSDSAPVLASHNGRLYLAWRGVDNECLNIMFSEDDGNTFIGKHTSEETSEDGPALASHNGLLFIAWKGSNNDALNVAKVDINNADFSIQGIVDKFISDQRSDVSPALASKSGRLFLAWKGVSNNHLNLMLSEDNGASFTSQCVTDQTSDVSPTLATRTGRLFIAWRGEDNENINLAKVTYSGSTATHLEITGLEDLDTLPETTEAGPALALQNERLYLCWKGSGNDNINLNYSRSSGFNFVEKHVSEEMTDQKPTLVSHNSELYLAWKGTDSRLNVARVNLYNS